jgi:hypothetical protein
MIKAMRNVAAIIVIGALSVGTAIAADELAKDLTSTIALLGLPCGQVISAKRLGENDYLATCKNKNRYRVYVNAQGRVVAEKR